jgi:dihydroceramidase
MPSWLPSIPYPPPDQPGYWDPVTSTLQWCEEDYYLTYYSAEIINTLTNVMFLYLSYKGIRSCMVNSHDTVFIVAYFGYFLVGIGSLMFHTTLKYPWQLVDELNMIYTTCLMLYASVSYGRPTWQQICLGIFLILFSGFITLYYHYLQDPVFHQNVYAALTVFIVFRSVHTMETSLRPYFKSTQQQGRSKSQKAEDARDLRTLNQMWILVAYGITIFLSGFAIWGLDNVYCGTLRRWRRQIGMPWGFLLEGHGWWHLMTGWGAYCYIVWGIHLRYILDGDQDKVKMVWPHLWNLPEIVRITEPNGTEKRAINGDANGTVKQTRSGKKRQ